MVQLDFSIKGHFVMFADIVCPNVMKLHSSVMCEYLVVEYQLLQMTPTKFPNMTCGDFTL